MNEEFYIGDLEAAIFIDAPAGDDQPRFVFRKTIINSFIKEKVETFIKPYQQCSFVKEKVERFWKKYIKRDFEV